MNLYDPIINYCERTAPGLWQEPLNAISNISFFIAGWLLLKAYRASGHKAVDEAILIGLIWIIAVGSTLFHTFANGLTMLMDAIPISIFTFYFLWVAMRRTLALSILKAAAGLLVFFALSTQLQNLPVEYSFNGSVNYFPALFALLIVGGTLVVRHSPSGPSILTAALLFIVSLVFRSIDYAVCPSFAFGTHFLWHLINGAVLYLLVKGILKSPPKTAS